MTDAPANADKWTLNNIAIVFIATDPQRIWDALIDPDASPHYFMGGRIHVGEQSHPWSLTNGDTQLISGTVLTREPPHLLRVTWEVPLPPDIYVPNCEVEYRIEPAQTTDGGTVSKLTISEFTDGPVPPQFKRAGQTGWALITSRLKSWLESGQPMPAVKLEPPK